VPPYRSCRGVGDGVMHPRFFKIKNMQIYGHSTGLLIREVISFFSRGGQHFDRLPRRGENVKKKIVCKNTKKSLFFKIRGANAPPAPHPPK